eukprot:6256030-Lingulodinium_polyedra.AAC.1
MPIVCLDVGEGGRVPELRRRRRSHTAKGSGTVRCPVEFAVGSNPRFASIPTGGGRGPRQGIILACGHNKSAFRGFKTNSILSLFSIHAQRGRFLA